MNESHSAATSQQWRKGGVSISPNSRNTSHSFTCHLPASSKFAPKMQNKFTSNCPLINVNLCAATEQQWRKGVQIPPGPRPPHHWNFQFQIVTHRHHQRSFKNYLKCNSTIVMMNENLFVTTEEQWRQTGANPPPTNHWNFHFWSCDLLRASIFDKNCLKCGSTTAQVLWWMKTCICCHWKTVAEDGVKSPCIIEIFIFIFRVVTCLQIRLKLPAIKQKYRLCKQGLYGTTLVITLLLLI